MLFEPEGLQCDRYISLIHGKHLTTVLLLCSCTVNNLGRNATRFINSELRFGLFIAECLSLVVNFQANSWFSVIFYDHKSEPLGYIFMVFSSTVYLSHSFSSIISAPDSFHFMLSLLILTIKK